jgi:two-component system, NarL family, invasion response regulator UvrY
MNQSLPTQIIRVALTDDHILLRDALAALIEKIPGFSILFLAENGKEMTEQIAKKGSPDILILDLNMPEMDGYEAAAWLKQHHPEIFILILTMFDTEIPLIRLLQEGVRGFVKKDIHPDELKTALQSLMKEGYYYPVQTVGKMVNLFQRNRQLQHGLDSKSLSVTDIVFLKLVCTDLTYREIAMEMNISPKTIDALRDQLFQRFEVKSRVGLAIYAVKHGIVNP